MNEANIYARVSRGLVGLGTGLALFLTSVPVAFAAPPRPVPRPGPQGSQPVEVSGDEVNPNSCRKWPANKRFTITIPREAELEQLVQWMMSISCQKFIWTNKIRASKVTILSPEKVTLREAYAAFYAALESIGLTVEPVGDYFKIIESNAPASANLPTYTNGSRAPSNDRYVTQLVRVNNGDAKQIADVLTKLKGKQGSIQSVGNLLIITDRGSQIRRLMKIVTELDVRGSGEKIFFYQLQYADANEVADLVRDIFGETQKSSRKGKKGSQTSSGVESRVIVDERTGTLIIVASESDYLTIKRLVEQLDVRLPGGGGRVHIKKLKNSDPKEVAQVLNTLVGRGGGSSKSKGKSKSGNKSATQGGATQELFAGDINVVADEGTRQLIILASAADYKNLEPVIDQLDTERKQVYIEVYMLEVSVARLLEAGAGGHFASQFDVSAGGQAGQATGFVSSSPAGDASSLVLSPELLTGLAGGVLGPQIAGTANLLGLSNDIPAFGVVIHALETDDDVNFVAQPHIYTADNQEAQLEVGERVPTQGQISFGGQGGGSAFFPQQSIQREDVTLEIKVTPHVNDSRTVSLDVEIEDRAVKSRDPTLGVTTTKRRFKLEKILARDDNPVVLGGLIRERETINNRQVPGLGSIPLLGWLFKRRSKQKEKVNLLVVMIPHIIETPDDLRRVHERRMQERQAFLERETGFKKRDLETSVNYRSKSGLLSTIDREARKLEREELQLRDAEAELAQESISGEIGLGVAQAGDDEDEAPSRAAVAGGAKKASPKKAAPRPAPPVP